LEALNDEPVALCLRFMASATLTLPLAFAGRHRHGVSQRRLFFFGKFRDGVSISSSASKRRVLAKAQNAVNEEVIETQSSELKNGTQRTPSSSKLVLVVGGSGGVGKLSALTIALQVVITILYVKHVATLKVC